MLRRLYHNLLLGMAVLTMILSFSQAYLVWKALAPPSENTNSSRLPQISQAYSPYLAVHDPTRPRFVQTPSARDRGPRIKLAPGPNDIPDLVTYNVATPFASGAYTFP